MTRFPGAAARGPCWWTRVRYALRGAAAAGVVLVAAAVLARQTMWFEKRLIFFPARELAGTPADLGLAFEDVVFPAPDGTALHGWFIPGPAGVTWLWFHGNAGNISHRLENIAMLRAALGVSIFIFDYRGYGLSEGSVSEQGTYLDADGALTYLASRPDVDPGRIVFFGRSLGAAVAVDLATRHAPFALVLESSFTSVLDLSRRLYPFVPVRFLIATRYDSLAKIGRLRAPVMVVHGDRDGVVPLEVGRALFQAANPPKRFFLVEGAGHNDTYVVGGAAYFDALRRFALDPRSAGDGQERDDGG